MRKLRELKGLNRKEAGVLLELTFKAVERFENGRTTLNRSRIDKILSAYGLTFIDFEECRDGKIEQIKKRLGHKQIKVVENNTLRRSYKRVITKEASVLQVLRRLKGLSQYKASFLCGYSEATIGHIENGRMEIPKPRIKHIVEAYDFTMEDFEYHMKSEVFVTDIQDDCISIIKGLGEEKLKAVYPLLSTFKN
ncbi:MAG: helix-turn-helix transcriptional regulator [Bdellovibrionales bacterium]|nr:helix-turn-helix transcriptional regulator [Bdellovibrionales bacterium]